MPIIIYQGTSRQKSKLYSLSLLEGKIYMGSKYIVDQAFLPQYIFIYVLRKINDKKVQNQFMWYFNPSKDIFRENFGSIGKYDIEYSYSFITGRHIIVSAVQWFKQRKVRPAQYGSAINLFDKFHQVLIIRIKMLIII